MADQAHGPVTPEELANLESRMVTCMQTLCDAADQKSPPENGPREVTLQLASDVLRVTRDLRRSWVRNDRLVARINTPSLN